MPPPPAEPESLFKLAYMFANSTADLAAKKLCNIEDLPLVDINGRDRSVQANANTARAEREEEEAVGPSPTLATFERSERAKQ